MISRSLKRVAQVIEIVSILAVAAASVRAATLPVLEDLKPGSFAVGFSTVERYDDSRTYTPPYNYFGERVEGETARPVQTCLWYPAAAGASSPALAYGEYVFPYPEDTRFFSFLAQLQAREIANLHGLLGGNTDRVMELLGAGVGAMRDAPHAVGSFPVIVYGPGRGQGVAENWALFEFLASHGFVVATSASVGAHDLAPAETTGALETEARDLEFVMAGLRDVAAADRERLALMGAGQGAQAALIVAMRNPGVRAVAVLGALTPAEGTIMADHPHFNPAGLAVPVLYVAPGAAADQAEETVKALAHADRIVLADGSMPAEAMTYRGVIGTLGSDTPGEAERVRRAHQRMGRAVLGFFQASLDQSAPAAGRLAALGEEAGADPALSGLQFVAAAPAPPTARQIRQLLSGQDVERAVAVCHRFGLPTPENPLVPENTLNLLGYRLLGEGRAALAVDLLRMATQAYPHSANAWDSYADASLQNGDRKTALAATRKAMALLETDTAIPNELREALETILPQRIRELEPEKAEEN